MKEYVAERPPKVEFKYAKKIEIFNRQCAGENINVVFKSNELELG